MLGEPDRGNATNGDGVVGVCVLFDGEGLDNSLVACLEQPALETLQVAAIPLATYL